MIHPDILAVPARRLAAAENVAVAGLARKLGAHLAGRGPGTAKYEIALVPPEYRLDWWFDCVDGPAQPVRDGDEDTGPGRDHSRSLSVLGAGGGQPLVEPDGLVSVGAPGME
jgi:hypothetical protein